MAHQFDVPIEWGRSEPRDPIRVKKLRVLCLLSRYAP